MPFLFNYNMKTVFILSSLGVLSQAFNANPFYMKSRGVKLNTRIFAESSDVIDVEAEEEEPGTMRVSEIKSELDLRGIDYSDCFDKESLAQKLVEARAK